MKIREAEKSASLIRVFFRLKSRIFSGLICF